MSKETDGFFNEEYCKWCYTDGKYTYDTMDDLIDFCAAHMANAEFPPEAVRAYMQETLPKLNYWKRYESLSEENEFDMFKSVLIGEINALKIEGMPEVKNLNTLLGNFINLPFRLPNGRAVKFLKDGETYLGNQLPCEFGGNRCFGVVANMDFILVCTYEEKGENPELVLYKKR